MAETAGPENDSSGRDKTSMATRLLPYLAVTGILGALEYASLIVAYDRFYDSMGLRPEDIDLDRVSIIARTLGLLPLLLIPLLFVAFLYLGFTFMRRLWSSPSTAQKPEGRYRRFETRIVLSRRTPLIVAIAGAIYILFVSVRVIASEIDLKAAQAVSGARVSPITAFGLPLVDLRAEPVEVDWVGDVKQRPYIFNPSLPQSFSYIGQRDGIVVLVAYPQETIRVPASNVTLTFICSKFANRQILPGRCQGEAERPGPRITVPSPSLTVTPSPSKTP